MAGDRVTDSPEVSVVLALVMLGVMVLALYIAGRRR